jgi:hypothetical protein
MTYLSSAAQAGRGSVLAIGATPTSIGEVKNVPLNRGKWDLVDTTNWESGSDSEQLVTIRKPGSVSFKGNRVSADAGQVLVEAAYQSGVLTAFLLTLPKTPTQTTTGDKYAFNAFVVGSNFTDDVMQAIEFDIELQISGACTLTLGS